MKLWITTLVAGACLAFSTNILMAQITDGQGDGDRARKRARPRDGERGERGEGERGDRNRGPGQGQRPPRSPLLVALDTDKDGVLSAGEIAAASASLAKLDKNGDGKIDRVELHRRRPRGGKDGKGGEGGEGGDRRRPPRGEGDGEGDGQRRRPRGPRDGNRRPPRGDGDSQE